jgi:hypothetical protein
VIVDDEKVQFVKNIWIITPGHNVDSYPWMTNKTPPGAALQAGASKVFHLLNSPSR